MTRYGMNESDVWILRSVLQEGRAKASASPPLIEKPRQWVDLVSEQEAKQLLLVRYLATFS
jgi:hypothetical protein